MAPKHGTRTAAKASAAAEPMRKLSEVPGVLEEGKIFFLYRQRLLFLNRVVIAVPLSYPAVQCQNDGRDCHTLPTKGPDKVSC